MTTRSYILTFYLVLFIKILFLGYVLCFGIYEFSEGNDADYYNSYAIGENDVAQNLWPVMLRFLNDHQLYNRGFITGLMSLLGALIIPLLFANIARIDRGDVGRKVFWMVAVCVSLYPTLFYFSFDIYRDVFMLFCFCLAAKTAQSFFLSRKILKSSLLFFITCALSYLLFLLRPYLGVAFLLAFFAVHIYDMPKRSVYSVCFLILFSLTAIFYLGLLEPLMKYRSMFSEQDQAGSNLGIVYDSVVTFPLKFVLSFLYQMCGFFIVNVSSLIVLIIESIPFLFFLMYLIINRKYGDKFVSFLLLFFVIYSAVWLLGNDNLGTAVRLRMHSYAAILICCSIVFQYKQHNNLVEE
ncbi:hypothetical protein SAMN04490207_1659 [Pseudomonas gessardii]|uniref:hypothetical protein n=1 Tax=Pseudomonas gessardii TaxID=78544 RepID=UPI000880613F|nr:hypothetical protein [Pseudomonas gessardii]MRU53744.1 hypothetical protein [Pseudomonas gessardii]ONH37905.1 hypothetical protein BLL38_25295 [Pseudomonas gessardii]SDQ72747.1 hypothetical protein SAMN04490207_1659 [Pseudomonas gessardii]